MEKRSLLGSDESVVDFENLSPWMIGWFGEGNGERDIYRILMVLCKKKGLVNKDECIK